MQTKQFILMFFLFIITIICLGIELLVHFSLNFLNLHTIETVTGFWK